MPKLSVCLIVKNEEKYLFDCLDSLRSLSPEFIVVDTGSTDSTISIAESFNCNIFHKEWVNDFSAARNESLKHATGEWILYIDADERLDKSSIKELQRIISSSSKTGYFCTLTSVDNSNGRPNMMRYIRLFRHSNGIRFEGRVHEQIHQSLRNNNYNFLDSGIRLIHLGYDISQEDMKVKALRNLNLLEEDYLENKLGYTSFQIGSSYAILNDKANASKYFAAAIEDTNLSPEYFAHSCRYIAALALESRNLDSASSYISQALAKAPKSPLVNIIAGKTALALGHLDSGFALLIEGYKNNKDLLSGKQISPFDIMISPEELLLEIISLASHYQSSSAFHFCVREMKNGKVKTSNQTLREINLIEKLFSNRHLNENDIKYLMEFITPEKSETYSKLILNLNDKHNANDLLIHISESYSDRNIKYALAMSYEGTEQHEKALLYLEEILTENDFDFSVLLQCISLTISMGLFEKSFTLISSAEKHVSPDSDNYKILSSIKTKIFSLIDQTVHSK